MSLLPFWVHSVPPGAGHVVVLHELGPLQATSHLQEFEQSTSPQLLIAHVTLHAPVLQSTLRHALLPAHVIAHVVPSEQCTLLHALLPTQLIVQL